MKQVLLLKDHLHVKQEVKDHIEALLSILSIQFEDGKEDKDFDSGVRIILHANAIQDFLKSRTYKLSERLLQIMKTITFTSAKRREDEVIGRSTTAYLSI